MQADELTPIVEAMLFAAGQPLSVNIMVKTIRDGDVGATQVKQSLEALTEYYDHDKRGFKLLKLGNGYQIVTREEYEPWVRRLLAGKQKHRLTRAALETVAVISYKQPLTRLDIERIRGVDVGGVLNTLLERGLIMIKGRDPGPGRPLLYGTTQGFLDYFGLSALTNLPRMDEIAELAEAELGSGWNETEKARFERLGVDPDSISEEAEIISEEDLKLVPGEEDEQLEFHEVVSGVAESVAEETEEILPSETDEVEAPPTPGV